MVQTVTEVWGSYSSSLTPKWPTAAMLGLGHPEAIELPAEVPTTA